jgi:hypothetical protein
MVARSRSSIVTPFVSVDADVALAHIGGAVRFLLCAFFVETAEKISQAGGAVAPSEADDYERKDDGVAHRSPHRIARMATALRMIPRF